MKSERIAEFQERFFSRVLAEIARPMEPEPVSFAAAEKGLFDLADALQRSVPASDEAGVEPVPEEALLEAIASMAEYGAEEAFSGMQPRLRRAVRLRIRTLLMIATNAGDAAARGGITYLPRGFPLEKVGMALLVTMGVEIPPKLRAEFE